jgi:hypothetical protein
MEPDPLEKDLDKHRALEALRRHPSRSGNANADGSPIQTVRDGRINPALFTIGLHDIFGETTADIAAATAFAFLAAGQNRNLSHRALLYARLAGDEQENGVIYGAGLDWLGIDPAKVCLVVARDSPNSRASTSPTIAMSRCIPAMAMPASRAVRLMIA